ncbi:MAG: hypothetical protein M1829_002053 [Trizodia sp. TS-e1964]|nr:MAG: hypothetical protein M1829_002053 [Trizodia sp. TS-e1964]
MSPVSPRSHAIYQFDDVEARLIMGSNADNSATQARNGVTLPKSESRARSKIQDQPINMELYLPPSPTLVSPRLQNSLEHVDDETLKASPPPSPPAAAHHTRKPGHKSIALISEDIKYLPVPRSSTIPVHRIKSSTASIIHPSDSSYDSKIASRTSTANDDQLLPPPNIGELLDQFPILKVPTYAATRFSGIEYSISPKDRPRPVQEIVHPLRTVSNASQWAREYFQDYDDQFQEPPPLQRGYSVASSGVEPEHEFNLRTKKKTINGNVTEFLFHIGIIVRLLTHKADAAMRRQAKYPESIANSVGRSEDGEDRPSRFKAKRSHVSRESDLSFRPSRVGSMPLVSEKAEKVAEMPTFYTEDTDEEDEAPNSHFI